MKKSLIVPILVLAFSFAVVIGASGQATQSRAAQRLATAAPLAPVTAPLTSTEAVYLPLVVRDYYYCPAADLVPSPFSLQVAALHEVQEVTMMGDLIVRPLSEAEWIAMYEEAFPTLMEALSESGAGWTRVRINWSWIQPDEPPAAYVWGPYHDVKLALLAETGVQLIATIGDAPEWAAETICAPIYPERLDDFAQFLTDLVNRYSQPPWNIRHWELINEPDFSWDDSGVRGAGCWGDPTTDEDGARYAEMLAVAYAAIKAADPQATVLMGGVAHDWFTEYGGPFDRYFPYEVMAAGGGNHIDALNFHFFPDFGPEWNRWDPRSNDQRYGWIPAPTCGDMFDGQGTAYQAWGIDIVAKTTHFRNRMAACFGVEHPIWVTEIGEHGVAGNPASLIQQARYVIQGHARGLSAGIENITWYALTTPNHSTDKGLLFEDWAPKPAFYAYQTLTAELAGLEYSHDRSAWMYDGSQLGFRYTREVYVFRDPCGLERTVAWSNDGALLSFGPARQLRVVDRNGHVTWIADGGAGDADGLRNGVIELQLTAEPVFVTVTSR